MKTKTHRIQIRPDIYERLVAQARKECRSPQTLLTMLIEAELQSGKCPAKIIPFRVGNDEERPQSLVLKFTPDEFATIGRAGISVGKIAREFAEESTLSAALSAKG